MATSKPKDYPLRQHSNNLRRVDRIQRDFGKLREELFDLAEKYGVAEPAARTGDVGTACNVVRNSIERKRRVRTIVK